MAKLRDARGRRDPQNSGYTRVFGNEELGQLISRVQATCISAGTELERFIITLGGCDYELDPFLERGLIPNGVFLFPKKVLKKSNVLRFSGFEPDFLVFRRLDRKQSCHVIELKDGDTLGLSTV